MGTNSCLSVPPQDEADGEERHGGEVQCHVRQRCPVCRRAPGERHEIHQAEDGGGEGAKNADSHQPLRADQERRVAVPKQRDDVENETRCPGADGDGRQRRVQQVSVGSCQRGLGVLGLLVRREILDVCSLVIGCGSC